MDDALRPLALEQGLHANPISHVQFLETEAFVICQARQQRFFEGNFVEIVDADDLIAPFEQTKRRVHADESGSTCYEDFHDQRLPSEAALGRTAFTS